MPGRSVNQRIKSLRRAGLRSHSYAEQLQTYLDQATQRVRKLFHGPLTYASLIFEHVDWSHFDIIGVDHYRISKIEAHYAERIRPYLALGKPVVIAEFGHSPYRGDHPGQLELGELNNGSLALHLVPLAGRFFQPRLKNGTNIRDEEHQAHELIKTLETLDTERVAGAFIWTFADPWLIHTPDPEHDLDMTSTALVKTYPDQSWDPKPSFYAVADFYAS